MNYIKELNALYDRQEQTPISGSAIALWSALMNINNKTRWKNTFTSPGSVLRLKAGITESSFKRARAELVEVGYIEVESQGRGKAPIYTMISLVAESEEKKSGVTYVYIEEREENSFVPDEKEGMEVHQHMAASSNVVSDSAVTQRSQEVTSVSPQQAIHDKDEVTDHSMVQPVNQQVTHVPTHPATHLPNQEAAPLLKQYQTVQNQNKQNKLKTAAADAREFIFSETEKIQSPKKPDAIKFYQENFGMASPFVAESLMDWMKELGEALVIEAMKRTLERNKTSWAYVKSILNAWHKKGIRTVDETQAEQVAFEQERKQKRGNRAFFAVQENIVPDWYAAEKERQRKKWEQAEVRDPEEEKRKQQKVEELLREFSG